METFLFLLAPALVGIGVGNLSGLLGIGGGTVLVPIFRLAFGLSPVVATATSLFTIVPTSISGAAAHVRGKTCLPALGVAMGLGGACTSPVGVWLASISPGWAIMLAAALVIGYSAINMLKKAVKMGPAKKPSESPENQAPAAADAPEANPHATNVVEQTAAPKAAPASASASASAAPDSASAAPDSAFSPDPIPAAPGKTPRKRLAQGVLIGLFAGVLSGYVGVGGGFIMIPLMVSFLGIDLKKASGTSLIGVMILAAPGAITQALLGNIDFWIGCAVVVGSIPGAVLGTRLQKHVPERQLRFLFGGFLILGCILLLVNEFAPLP